MNKFYISVLAVCCCFGAIAQSKKINEITEFKLRNSGAIMTKENSVNGYYFFYLIDKLKKGEAEYGIKILDNNLNEVALKKHVASKHLYLMETKFNNDALMFSFIDRKEKMINLVGYDNQANKLKTEKVELSKKELIYMAQLNQSNDYNMLFPVPNGGFLLNRIKDNRKLGYVIDYFPTNGGKSWSYGSPEESKEIIMANPIEVNERYMVLMEFSRPGMLSQKVSLTTKVIDVVTGKLITQIDHDDNEPKLITNAFLDADDQLVLLGEYFEAGDKIMKAESQGLFVQVLNSEGTVVKQSRSSWKNEIAPKLKNVIEKENYYVYFHDIVPTANGHYYAIGEKFRKTASAGGIAMAVLSRGQSPVTQLTITDALIFDFDADFNLQKVDLFEKGTSRAPSVSDFGSPQLNAHALVNLGGFDYEYTQIDRENDRFYACFTDYERLKGEKNKMAFKTIIYDEGEFSQDKIYLDEKGKFVRILPAKIGNVVLLEYDRKAKELEIHMEKLNIE